MSRRVSLGLAFAVTLLAGSLGCGPTAGTGAGTVSPGGYLDPAAQIDSSKRP